MAALWWHSQHRVVSVALSGVGELKSVVLNSLQQLGYTDTHLTASEIAGGKDGVWVAIQYLLVADRTFWEVVAASGDNSDTTKAQLDEVLQMLAGLRFQ